MKKLKELKRVGDELKAKSDAVFAVATINGAGHAVIASGDEKDVSFAITKALVTDDVILEMVERCVTIAHRWKEEHADGKCCDHCKKMV